MKNYRLLVAVLFIFLYFRSYAQITTSQLRSILEIVELINKNEIDSLNNLNLIDQMSDNCDVKIIQEVVKYRANTDKWPNEDTNLFQVTDEKLNRCIASKNISFSIASDTLYYFSNDSVGGILGLKIFLEENKYVVSHINNVDNKADEIKNEKKQKAKKANRIEW